MLTSTRDSEIIRAPKNAYPKYCLKMATGTGKTWVLQALMVWQILNANRAPDSDRYTKNFLVVAPGLIVYDRLLDAFMGKERDGKRDFSISDLSIFQELFIPDAYRDEVFRFVQGAVCPKESIGRKVTAGGIIAISNWHVLSEESEPLEDEEIEAPGDSLDPKTVVQSIFPLMPGTNQSNDLAVLNRRYERGGILSCGIAQMMRVGLYRPVHVKTLASQKIRTLLSGRRFLQAKLLDVENSIRGLLRNFGLKVGLVSRAQYEARILELIEEVPSLRAIVEPMLMVRRVVREQYVVLHKRMLTLARADADCLLLMSAPGVGPLVALTYRAAVDEPARFQRSRSVGAHFGLAPRTHQSGEIDRRGRITKNGDETLRAALFESALVLLRPQAKPSALKAWGLRVARRRGMARAMIAVARRLSVILHRMWVDRVPFRWTAEPDQA